MSFPDDYQRNQQAGGPSAQIADLLGLPRQILIDTTTWTVILMDGTTEGGHPVVMLKDLATYLQVNNYLPQGDSALVSNNSDETQAAIQRAWSAAELRKLFNLLATTATPGTWKLKNVAMPDQLKESAPVVTDTNTALVSGWYRFNPASTLNLPGDIVATNSDRCPLFVIGKDSSNLTQIIFSMEDDGKMWKRVFVAGAPTAWQGTAGVTQASVDAKVAKAGDTMTGRLNLMTPIAGSAPLRLPTGVAPTTPIDGDLWRRDADGGLRLRKGGTTVTLLDTTTAFRSQVAHIGDQKPQGTVAQAIAAGVWTARNITTEFYDPDNIVSIAGNTFTPIAGSDYKVIAVMQASSFSGANLSCRFYNVTDAVVVSGGTLNGLQSNNTGATTIGQIECHAILTGGKTYQVEALWTNGGSGGLGVVKNAAGMPEIYMTILLEKLLHVV